MQYTYICSKKCFLNKQNNDIYLNLDFAIFKKYSINLFFFKNQGFDKIILVFFHLLKIHKLLDQRIAKIYITLHNGNII